MNVKVPVKVLRNIVAWLVEKDDMKFSYSKQLVNELNNHNQNENIIEIPSIIIGKICEYVEYLAAWDKLGRYGNFYYEIKRLTK